MKKIGIGVAVLVAIFVWFVISNTSDNQTELASEEKYEVQDRLNLGISKEKIADFLKKNAKNLTKSTKNIECNNADECFNMAKQMRLEVNQDIRTTLKDIEESCLAGSGYSMSCVALGYLYSQDIPQILQNKLGIIRNFSKANALLDKACQMGNNFGCSLLAVAYFEGNGVEIDNAKVQSYMKKSQKYGKLEQLTNNIIFMTSPFAKDMLSQQSLDVRKLGAMALDNKETMNLTKTILGISFLMNMDEASKRNIPQAKALLEQSCLNNESIACNILGVLTSKGFFFKQNNDDSFAFLKKSCQNNDGIGCALLSRYYQDGIGTKIDRQEARQLFDKAQYGYGSLEGVLSSYALSLYEVIKPTNDVKYDEILKRLPFAFVLFDTPNDLEKITNSCKKGSVIDCNILGAFYLVQQDSVKKEEGFELVKKNCKNGDNFGCTILGLNYQFGLSTPVDLKKSKQLFEKTQKNGTLESVANTAVRFAFYALKSLNDRQDLKQLLQYSCQNGLKAECDAEKVFGIFEKYDTYQTLLSKSCEMGKKEACNP